MTNYLNLAVQAILIIVLIIIAMLLYRLSKSLKKEQRITKYTIDAISDKPVSFFDKMEKIYLILVKNLTKLLSKSKIFVKYGMKYEKYIDQTKKIRTNPIDYVSNKILIGLVAVIITIISDVLRLQSISVIQLLIAMVVGYILPDILLSIQHKRYTKQIENDLLKAVIIMGNAFKSGRSIMQAVQLVATELEGPISDEFKKMFIDLTYGLELETVFDRFADRVKLEEVEYMSSSLVILNKTGGNIVKVFSTIENSFFERKKLNEEMKSTLALSDLVFKVLVAMPFIVFVIIYIFNPTYFTPLVTTQIGIIILLLILLIYTGYIIVVKQITKLRV